MISKDEAKNVAMAEILKWWGIEDSDPIILEEYTIEKEFGWVFFYDSRKHVETQAFEDTVLGNAPIIVNRLDASTHSTGTALPTEHYIRDYEERLRGGKKNGASEVGSEA